MNWVSAREAAKILGVSYQAVYNWIALGKIQPMGEVAGTHVFDRAYIERLAKTRTRHPNEGPRKKVAA